jgi:hypothetical protein
MDVPNKTSNRGLAKYLTTRDIIHMQKVARPQIQQSFCQHFLHVVKSMRGPAEAREKVLIKLKAAVSAKLR